MGLYLDGAEKLSYGTGKTSVDHYAYRYATEWDFQLVYWKVVWERKFIYVNIVNSRIYTTHPMQLMIRCFINKH
jgi:hypothetical protein